MDGWRQEVEAIWYAEPDSLSRRKRLAKLIRGFTFIADNIGWVRLYSR